MEKEIKVLKAVADPTRLRITCLLSGQKSLCVCEIINAMKMKQSAISKALKVLKEAGVILDEKKAQWVYYSLNREKGSPGYKILESIMSGAVKNPVIASDASALRQRLKKKCKGE